MEKTPQISIIVPIYNVEKYVKKCVDSIINQTFKDLEIILVDDGSTDNSCIICDEVAKKDSRIRVIHKPNGGLSDARNTGIDSSCGEYLGFVDGDDHIAPDMYEMLYNNLKKENADVSICGIYSEYDNKVEPVYPIQEYFTLGNSGAVKLVMDARKISVNACNKLFRKSLFNNIKFPIGKLSEDAFIMVKLLANAEKVVIDTSAKYYYVHRENSITMSDYKKRDLDVIEAYTLNRDFIKKNFPSLMVEANFRYFWAHLYVLDKMLLSKNYIKDDDYKKIIKTIRKNYFKIIKNPLTGRKRKIALTALAINATFYKKIVLSHYNKNRKLVN